MFGTQMLVKVTRKIYLQNEYRQGMLVVLLWHIVQCCVMLCNDRIKIKSILCEHNELTLPVHVHQCIYKGLDITPNIFFALKSIGFNWCCKDAIS